MTAIPDDILAVAAVVTGDDRTNLTGRDRDEAVRLMAHQHTSTEIARRLHTGADEIARTARRLGLTLHQPDPWNWYAYIRGYDRQQRQAVAA